MKTELFIKAPVNASIDGIKTFMIPKHGTDEVSSYGRSMTDLKKYKVTIIVTEPKDGSALTGRVGVSIGDASMYFYTTGTHTVDLTPTTFNSNPYTLISTENSFNGGVYWVSTVDYLLTPRLSYKQYNVLTPISTYSNPTWYDSVVFGRYTSNVVITETGQYSLKITTSKWNTVAVSGSLTIYLGDDVQTITTLDNHELTFNVTAIGDGTLNIIASDDWNASLSLINLTQISATVLKQVDLYSDVDVPITFNIADIKDITKKNASFSKTISIPGTKVNNDIFKHIYKINTDGSFTLNKAVSCYILQDTFQVFEGAFELTQCTINSGVISYEGVVYSLTSDFFGNIASSYLRGNEDITDDIDFSEHDHQLTNTNQLALMNGAVGEGITYVAIDKYAKDINNPTINGRKYKPEELSCAIYIKEIWDKIFENAGFTYTSEFIDSDFFKRLIYPDTKPYQTLLQNERLEMQLWRCYGGVGETYHSAFKATNPPTLETDTSYNNDYTDSADPNNRGQYAPTTTITSNSITVQKSGEYTLSQIGSIEININNVTKYIDGLPYTEANWFLRAELSGAPSVLITHQIYLARDGKADLLLSSTDYGQVLINIEMESSSSKNTLSKTSINYNDITRFFNGLDSLSGVPDRIYTKIIVTYPSEATWFSGATIYEAYDPVDSVKVEFDIEIDTPDTLNNYISMIPSERIIEYMYVKVNNIIHEKIKQADFINSISKMFNLYFEPTGVKSFLIEPRDDYYQQGSTIKDWTNKLDLSKDIEIKNTTSLVDTLINFTYDSDKDKYNENYTKDNQFIYGEYYKEPEDNLSKDKLEIKLLFAPTICGHATNDGNWESTGVVVPKIYKLEESDGVLTLDSNAEFKPRVLWYGGLQDSEDVFVYLHSDGTEISRSALYPFASHFTGIHGDADADLNWDVCAAYYESSTWESVNAGKSVACTANNLYNVYYKNMMLEYNDPDTKMISMYLYLDPIDISDLRFNTFIFIDDTYYRLNKIIDYVPGKLTKIELLKIQVQDISGISDYYIDDVIVPAVPAIDNTIGLIEGGLNTVVPGINNAVLVDKLDGIENAVIISNTVVSVDYVNNTEIIDSENTEVVIATERPRR